LLNATTSDKQKFYSEFAVSGTCLVLNPFPRIVYAALTLREFEKHEVDRKREHRGDDDVRVLL